MKISPEQFIQASEVARYAGEQMLARLELFTVSPAVIVEIGVGRDDALSALRNYFSPTLCIAIDAQHTMLQHMTQLDNVSQPFCAVPYKLPLLDNSVDLLFANLVLPWCSDVKQTLHEWQRVLKPEGLLLFSSLGPNTLQSLRANLGDYLLPNLIDMHEIGDALVSSQLQDPVLDVEEISLRYHTPEALLTELRYSKMVVPECVLTENINIADYEIVYGHAWGSNASSYQETDGITRIPLNRLRLRASQM